MSETATEESNLITHARRELQLAGLFDEDSDYGGMLGEAVMKLVEAFAGEGHSGYSAMMTIDIFSRLAKYQNLSPLTNSDDEWNYVGTDMWRSSRRSDAFSLDAGETYYILGEDPRVFHNSLVKE